MNPNARTLDRKMAIAHAKRNSPYSKCVAAEETFRRVMQGKGVTLERPKEPFWFIKSCYLPDFYSPAENIYYEVVGGDSQRHQLFFRLDLMEVFYPEVVIRPVRPDGLPYRYRLHRSKRDWITVPFAARLHEALDYERMTCRDLAIRLGMSPSRLSMALNGYRRGSASNPEILSRVHAWLSSVEKIRNARREAKRGFVTTLNDDGSAVHSDSHRAA